jgi:nitroreductase
MRIKSLLKQLPGLEYLYRLAFKQANHLNDFDNLGRLSNEELLSLMRHESHRIEKTIYNNILEKKYSVYHKKWEKLSKIYQILKDRNYPSDEPTMVWSKKIYYAFEHLEKDFIQANSSPAPEFNPHLASPFIQFLRERRSVRVWAEEQPDKSILLDIAKQMIDAARWAPTSGNRQPWRFLILTDAPEKELLTGIKENHCITAPLLIFVGMDTRFYGALGNSERSIYIDAGAAIMQMVLMAHKCGLGVCWNHFADDLISARKANQVIYSQFAQSLNIPEYISPIAIIATGIPKFIPPEPARMDVDSLLISPIKST